MNRILLMCFCLTSLSGCASSISGSVIEGATEKPISGAIVYAEWMHYGSAAGVHSRTSCVQIDFATTDSNGRYELPGVAGNVHPILGVYKPGYEEIDTARVYGYPVPQKTPSGEKWLVMRPFTGTVNERLEYLSKQRGKECNSDSAKRSNQILPFYRRLYDEGKSLPPTSQADKKIVRGLLFSVEAIEVGEQEALKRLEDRRLRGAY